MSGLCMLQFAMLKMGRVKTSSVIKLVDTGLRTSMTGALLQGMKEVHEEMAVLERSSVCLSLCPLGRQQHAQLKSMMELGRSFRKLVHLVWQR